MLMPVRNPSALDVQQLEHSWAQRQYSFSQTNANELDIIAFASPVRWERSRGSSSHSLRSGRRRNTTLRGLLKGVSQLDQPRLAAGHPGKGNAQR